MSTIPEPEDMTREQVKEAAHLQVWALLDELAHGLSPVPMFLVKRPDSEDVQAFPPDHFEELFKQLRDILQKRIKEEYGLCYIWDCLQQENDKLRERVQELEEDLGYRRAIANRLAGKKLDLVPELSKAVTGMLKHMRLLGSDGNQFQHPWLSQDDLERILMKWVQMAKELEKKAKR